MKESRPLNVESVKPSTVMLSQCYTPSKEKWGAFESGRPEKVPGKGAFYYINHHNSGTFSGLPDSTARNFEVS